MSSKKKRLIIRHPAFPSIASQNGQLDVETLRALLEVDPQTVRRRQKTEKLKTKRRKKRTWRKR